MNRQAINNENMPWIEKYRPNTLDEIIDHKIKIDILRKMSKTFNLPHLLFYGAPGSGKTSMIHACARDMYGENYKKFILELNASNDRGIETVRTLVCDFLKSGGNNIIKLVILDEADAMTNDAQSALKRIIETYSGVGRFCIICNNISKINQGIRSRCTEIKFTYLSPEQIKIKLREIIIIEKINITEDAIDRIIEINRDFRQILNLLQCLHFGIKNNSNEINFITSEYINKYVGIPTDEDVLRIIKILNTKNYKEASHKLIELYLENKWDLRDILKYLLKYIIENDDIHDNNKIKIIKTISDIENKVINQSDIKIQLHSLLAGWYQTFNTYN